MHYVYLVIYGVSIGLIAAVPIGPVNLICIRRTLQFGPLNGFFSGTGAAVGDGVFAIVTGFGLTAIAQLIEGYSSVLELVGGALLIGFGIHSFYAHPNIRLEDGVRVRDRGASTLLRAMASTFALTVTNPATLLAFTALFAGFSGLAGADASFVDTAVVVGGVVGGSVGWWLALTTVIGIFHHGISEHTMRAINKGSGVVVALFGVVVLVHLATKLF